MTWRSAPGVVAEFLDGEAVLFSAADAQLHRLNPLATEFWKHLVTDLTVGLDVHDVETLAELATFAEELAATGLIVRDDGPDHAH